MENDMNLVTAARDGHTALYHYQSFADKSVGYLEDTLRERTIHMSKPADFNDPWDCRPWFDETDLDDPVEREKYVGWLLRAEVIEPEEIQRVRETPKELLAYAEVMHGFLIRTINDMFRVYCLTPDPLHPLMWSHYGGGHTGIALEFDSTTPQLQYAYRVFYRKEYPPIRMYEKGANAEYVPIYTKSHLWRYEHEYRLVGEERRSALSEKSQHGVPMLNNQKLRLERSVLTGVVIGCQCNYERVMAVIDKFGPDLRVRRAALETNQYALTLETVR
jgi:hypothetical protein